MTNRARPLLRRAAGKFRLPAFLALGGLLSSAAVPAFADFRAELRIEINKPAVELSPHLYGLFFEDINYGADGGLYAELVQNRSFEYFPRDNPEHTPLFVWEKIEREGARATLSVADARPLNANNRHYLEISVAGPAPGRAGVANTGFDGIRLDAGARYDFSVHARVENWSGPSSLAVTLELPDGTPAGSLSLEGPELDGRWRKLEGAITADRSADRARLVVTTSGRGTLSLDMVSLFPQDTWRGRKNGLRKDLVQAMADLKPGFLRFPGGCITHGHGLENAYRWKDTVGDIAERKPNWNLWGYHQTYGLGYFEYFQLCEDLGALALPVLPTGVSCGYRGLEIVPMDKLQPHIQDALDLVEFANGPAHSRWGSLRARMGHPAPFDLRYLCLGNEEHDTPEVRERFPLFVRALREAHPEIKIIGTSGLSADVPLYDLMARERVHSSDEHYYELPDWFIHHQKRFDSFDRSKPKIFIGEYASWGNNLFNALAEAAYLTGVERNGDIVDMTAYAPLLARSGHAQWHPNLIYFDQRAVLRTVNYHVQRLFSLNKGDSYLSHSLRVEDAPAPSIRGRLGFGSAGAAVEIASIHIDDQPVDLAAWTENSGRFTITPDGHRLQSEGKTGNALLLGPAPAAPSASTAPLRYRIRARKTSGASGGLIVLFGADSAGKGGYVWTLGADGKSRHQLHKVGAYDWWVKLALAETDGPALTGEWQDIALDLDARGHVLCSVDGKPVIDHTLAPLPLSLSPTLDRSANELILKLVNPNEESAAARVTLAGVAGAGPRGRLSTLSGPRDAHNSFDTPSAIAPASGEIAVAPVFEHQIPAMSVQVLRIPVTR